MRLPRRVSSDAVTTASGAERAGSVMLADTVREIGLRKVVLEKEEGIEYYDNRRRKERILILVTSE